MKTLFARLLRLFGRKSKQEKKTDPTIYPMF